MSIKNQLANKNLGEIDSSIPDLTDKTGGALVTGMWGIDAAVIKEIANVNRIYTSKHGMFSAIPIVCNGSKCPYANVCMISKPNRKVGRRCPMEISAILSRYEQWCEHFGIDTSEDKIDPKDLVDVTLIKDLIGIEIQMIRAENKIALNGDFMADVLLDIDNKCNAYYGKDISPETQFLNTLQERKIKILNQLNATRKDKAVDKRRETASDDAIKIFQQLKQMHVTTHKTHDISDVDFDDEGRIIEVVKPETVPENGAETNGSEIENTGGGESY